MPVKVVKKKAAPKKKVDKPAPQGADLSRLESKLNSLLKEKTSGMAGTAGHALGALVGMPGAGRAAGEFLGRVFGLGDYHVEVNSLVNPGSEMPVLRDEVPKFGSSGASEDVVRVRHREYIGLLYSGSTLSGGATTFAQQRFRLNPGNPAFPYLSGSVAQGFKEWLPLGAVIELRPLASEVSTSATLGSMGVAVDYDSTDPPYASKLQALESDGAVSGRPTEELLFGIECKPSLRPTPWLYTRFSNVSSQTTQAINAYDLGMVTCFTEGMPVANTAVAEIWWSCDLVFSKKLLLGGLVGAGVTTLEYYVPSSSAINAGNIFGNGTQPSWYQSNTGASIAVGPSNITLPNTGVYKVTAFWSGTGGNWSVSSGLAANVFSNCALVGFAGNNSYSTFTAGATTGTYFLDFIVQAQGSYNAPAILYLNNMGWSFAGTASAVWLTVTQIGQTPSFTPSSSVGIPATILNGTQQGIGWN